MSEDFTVDSEEGVTAVLATQWGPLRLHVCSNTYVRIESDLHDGKFAGRLGVVDFRVAWHVYHNGRERPYHVIGDGWADDTQRGIERPVNRPGETVPAKTARRAKDAIGTTFLGWVRSDAGKRALHAAALHCAKRDMEVAAEEVARLERLLEEATATHRVAENRVSVLSGRLS